MARMYGWDDCHHRYKLASVVRHVVKGVFEGPRTYKFRCTRCYRQYETTRRKIWYPTKMVELIEWNARELAKLSPLYTADDLLNILREQLAFGKTSVWLNLERQRDGSWVNKAFDDSEEI